MRRAGQLALEALDDVAVGDLRVVEIELQAQVRRADLADDALCLVIVVQVEAGNIAPVDRLEHQRQPEPGSLFGGPRSEEHTSELQSLMRISYAVFCLKKKKKYRQCKNTLERH